jgi:hypothetical protein
LSGEGVKSNSDAIPPPPPSLSLGIGMASCGDAGWATDDDNNTGTLPGIAFPGCAAMFPSKLGSTFVWFPETESITQYS